MNARGLTIIEVLMSLVLLAVVAAAVVPMVHADHTASNTQAQSAFSAQFAERVAQLQQSNPHPLTIEQLRELAEQLGATCTPPRTTEPDAFGQWVEIRRDHSALLYWAPRSEAEGPP